MISSDKRVRMMLVDDHPVVKMGLKMMLEQSRGFEIVGEASDGVEAVATAEQLQPDVIVMDVMMPELDGIEACRTIMEKLPATQVLMLTASTEKDAVIEAVAAGATGYLQKYSGGEALEEAVRAIAGPPENTGRGPDRSGPPENTGRGPEENPGAGPQRTVGEDPPQTGLPDRAGLRDWKNSHRPCSPAARPRYLGPTAGAGHRRSGL